MDLHFYPYDFDYKLKGEKVLVYLYGKTDAGKKICVIQEHQPFFYVRLGGVDKEGAGREGVDKGPEVDKELLFSRLNSFTLETRDGIAKIISWEEVEKELLGKKEKFLKIYTNFPKAVPPLSRELESWGLSCYERDILFIHRYLRDKGITPMTLVKATGSLGKEDNLRIPAFFAESIEQESKEALANPRILAIDIETYSQRREIDPHKNPILMVGLYGVDEQGQEFQKVITWKRFAHHLEYIEYVQDEVELLKRFRDLIVQYDPDIITGYFTDGFDFPYLKTRADKHKVVLDLCLDGSELSTGSGGGGSRGSGGSSSSRATTFREGETKIKGLLHLDMLKFIRNIFGKDLKTESFSLDAVAGELLGHGKHPVNVDELSHVWDQEPERLADFCAYNLHDAHLANKLCRQLLPDMLEFTKLIGLPTFDLIRMRFSRLVENYILKRALEFNVIAPNKPADQETEERREKSIEGAFVLEPAPGLYQNIIVFDFRSLYPTIITAHNIGPEGFQCNCCKEKEHVPEKNEYWFCQKEKKFLPSVLEELILRRADLKRLVKEEKAKGNDTKILEARSYALKILANSFYGYLGFYGARWYSIESAASTTAYARNYIKQTIKKAGEKGFKVIYGDSLTPDRKIFVVNKEGEINLFPIGEFVETNYNNSDLSQFKTFAFDGEKIVLSPIRRVIRHEYDSSEKGEILHFITTYGSTKVTPQHSVYKYVYPGGFIQLVDATALQEGDFLVSLTNVPRQEKHKEGQIFDLATLSFGPMEEEISFYTDNLEFPAKKGTCPYCGKEVYLASHVNLRHKERRAIKQKVLGAEFKWAGTHHAKGGKVPRYWALTPELAWILGYYCAEGSASDIKTKSGSRKCMISFGSQDKAVIERVKKYFDEVLQDDLKIIVDYDKRINKEIYYYRIQRISLVALLVYGFDCGKKSTGKKVPPFIYSGEEKIRRAFLDGYLEGDGSKKKDKRYYTHFTRCDTNSKDLACGIHYLFKSLRHGFTYYKKEIRHVGWRYRPDKPLISSLRLQSAKEKYSSGNKAGAKIKEIRKERYVGPVYDLEVEGYHNFVDAEGLLLVHNTDSMFMLLGAKIRDHALEFMNEINFDLPGHMELEFQGFYPQGLFVAQKGTGGEKGAKKRYALLDEKGKVKITGFETVRRNWSPIGKEVQEKVLSLVLTNQVEAAVQYVKEIVKKLKKGEVPLRQLIIKTQITRELDDYASVGPHVTVARRMQGLGERVLPGTLIEYVITKGVGLVRERAKLPSEAKEGEYDADYYINHQLLPAVAGIFAVLGYSEEDLFKESSQVGLGKFL